jgi:hypothetical protein
MPTLLETPSPETLSLRPSTTKEEMLACMGIGAGKPVKKRLLRYIDAALPIVHAEAQPKMVWKTAPVADLVSQLPPSRRLRRYFQGMDQATILAGTAGTEWAERTASEKDPMKAYVLNSAATAIARSILNQARRMLADRNPHRQIAAPISPGNDGLPLTLQKGVAHLLPLQSIGIEMEAHSLFMIPLASVTAIIGIGPQCQDLDPLAANAPVVVHCQTCPSPACALRVAPFQSNRAPER